MAGSNKKLWIVLGVSAVVGIGIAMKPRSLVALGLVATITGALVWLAAAALLPFWLRWL